MRGPVRLWQGSWLFVWLITSCQVPAAPHRTPASEVASASVRVPAKTDVQATMKIASLIRDVVRRMRDDGITPDNVASRSAAEYSNAFVRVDTRGHIHSDITVTGITPEVIADLRALEVQNIQSRAGQTIVQGWIPFDQVERVAALSFVHHIRPPRYAMPR